MVSSRVVFLAMLTIYGNACVNCYADLVRLGHRRFEGDKELRIQEFKDVIIIKRTSGNGEMGKFL